MRRVLVIDDNTDTLEYMKVLLEGSFAVFTATNGHIGLSLLEQGLDPCIIFCDLQMPVLDGEAFCRTWFESNRYSNIPVILMSGVSNLSSVAARAHVTGFLGKPANSESITRMVDLHARGFDPTPLGL